MQSPDRLAKGLLYNTVINRLVPEKLRGTGDIHELRARLIPLFAAGLALIGLVFCLIYAFVLEMPWGAWTIAAGIVLVTLTPFLMKQFGRYGPAAHWISINFYWVVLILTLLTGGLNAPALRWMAVVPVYALVFCGLWSALGWVALVTATYLAFYIVPALGYPISQPLTASELQLLRLLGMAGLTVLILELFLFHGWLVDNLRAAHAKLREDDRRKNQFLAMLGHELRNPFSSIANGVAVLKRLPTSEQADRQIAIMDRQVGSLGRMLDDLLDIARITRGTFELQRKRIDLVDAVTSALETIEGQYPESDRDIRCDFPSTPVWVDADPVRLEQIFGDLVSNAFKYTESDGTIWVTVVETDEDDGDARVRIRDDGCGMSDEELNRIFELFDRGRAGMYDAEGGLGVGLTVVQRLVEAHGGQIEADSPGPGQGSEFVVSFPLSETPTGEPEQPGGD